MRIKWQQSHIYQQPNLKSKNKTHYSDNSNRNRMAEMEVIWRVISGRGWTDNGGKGTGNKKH